MYSQPWYNFSDDTPVRSAKPVAGPSRLIAALDTADIIEISSSEDEDDVIELTGVCEIPSRCRAATAKSIGKAAASGSNATLWVTFVWNLDFVIIII